MNRKEFARRALMSTAMAAAAPLAGWGKQDPQEVSPVHPSTPGEPQKDRPNSRPSADPANSPLSFRPLFNGRDLSGFVDVNTSKDTWWVEEGILKASGHPTGVMRTEKQYQNFILDIEWRHTEPGGNSGIFVWSDGTPHGDTPYPRGMEVQMLDPQWAEIHDRPVEYVHGHLFPAQGLPGTIPDNRSQIEGRSKPLENRVRPTGEWNHYIVVCVDGTIKLSVNGKFVNGIRSPRRKKGYICPESEGAEVHFRKIDILELPGGVITSEQAAPILTS